MNDKRILLVDDDEEICQEMSQILSDEGYDVSSVFDGLKAKDLIDKNNFPLILLDLKIPRLSGFDLLKHIKAKTGSKVIILSARPMRKLLGEKVSFDSKGGSEADREEEEILRLADDFINKPFEVENVLKKIKEVRTP